MMVYNMRDAGFYVLIRQNVYSGTTKRCIVYGRTRLEAIINALKEI